MIHLTIIKKTFGIIDFLMKIIKINTSIHSIFNHLYFFFRKMIIHKNKNTI